MAAPPFSSSNRITADLIRRKRPRWMAYCRGAFGTQSDVQCLGYDALCGLAIALFDPAAVSSTEAAVSACRQETVTNQYCRGFVEGWDGYEKCNAGVSEEFKQGYADGRAVCLELVPHGWRHQRLASFDVAPR